MYFESVAHVSLYYQSVVRSDADAKWTDSTTDLGWSKPKKGAV